MYSLLILVSSLLLVTGAIAQGYDYGGSNSPSYGSGSGSGGSGSSSSAGSESSSVNSPTSCASASKAMPHTHISKETSTPDGSAKVHIVKVSNKKGNLTFEPNDLTAAVGSLVQFHFYPKNHSVVESTFDNPCVPIHNVKPENLGLFSGFMPVEANATELPAYTIKINDTKPVWYYCSQGKHCQQGMVGVINAPAGNKSLSVSTFAELAKVAPNNISPSAGAAGGSSTGSGSGSSSGSGSGSGSSGSSSPSSSTLSTATASLASTAVTSNGSSISNTSAPATFTGSGNTMLANKQNLLAGIGLSTVFVLSLLLAW